MGLPSDKYKDIPDVLNEKFGNASKPIPVITRKSIYISDNDSSSSTSSTTVTMNITFDPLILGISGDQTQHLLYRIQNGQQFVSSYEYVSNPNSIFVIMISTNNGWFTVRDIFNKEITTITLKHENRVEFNQENRSKI